MIETFDFVNQITTNRRLAQVEEELGRQRQLASQVQMEHAELQDRREILFSIREEIQKLLPLQLSRPAYCLSILKLLEVRIEANQISVATFPDFIDKEYALRVLETFKEMRSSCEGSLEKSDREDINNLVRLQMGLPHARKLEVWLTIREALPRTPCFQRLTGHNAVFWMTFVLGCYGMVALTQAFLEEFPSNILPLATQISGTVIGLVLIRGLWFSVRRMLVMNRLGSLATTAGADLPRHSTRESVRKFIDWEGNWIAEYKLGDIPKNSHQCAKLIGSTDDTITLLTKNLL